MRSASRRRPRSWSEPGSAPNGGFCSRTRSRWNRSRRSTRSCSTRPTLTKGEPEVVAVVTADALDEGELLRLSAAVERESEHPLAEAIVRAAEARRLEAPKASAFEALAGHGALATVEGHRVALGNARLLEREHVPLDGLAERARELAGQGRTVVHVARDGKAAGLVAIADAPRKTAAE